jgi:hypothetical protein
LTRALDAYGNHLETELGELYGAEKISTESAAEIQTASAASLIATFIQTSLPIANVIEAELKITSAHYYRPIPKLLAPKLKRIRKRLGVGAA